MVTEFRPATVSPDSNGVFQVELPYLTADATDSSCQPCARFRLMLRDSKTWKHIASNLEPEVPELRLKAQGLQPLALSLRPQIHSWSTVVGHECLAEFVPPTSR